MKCGRCQKSNVYCYCSLFVYGKCVQCLLFNKNVIVDLVLIMEWIFSCLVFILGGNANYDGKMVGANASKNGNSKMQ